VSSPPEGQAQVEGPSSSRDLRKYARSTQLRLTLGALATLFSVDEAGAIHLASDSGDFYVLVIR